MKNSKRIMCIILAVVVMLGTMGVMTAMAETSTGASQTGTTVGSSATSTTVEVTGAPKYVTTFNESQGNKLLTCNEMTSLLGQTVGKDGNDFVEETTKAGATVKYNADGSMVLSKAAAQYGVNLEVPVTAEMKEAYTKATDNNLIVSYYLSKALKNTSVFSDAQVRIYTRFKTATDSKYLKISSIGSHYCDAYQQVLNKSFQLVDFNNNPLANLDNVQSIIICLYNYNKDVVADLQFSGITYEGVPEIAAFKAPSPAGVNTTQTLATWNSDYDMQWGDHPATVKYFADGGTDTSNYKSYNTGWVYMKHINPVNTKMLSLFYKLDKDKFNQAIATANQEGGSGKASISINTKTLSDTTGKDVKAEFQIQITTYDNGTLTPVQEWVSVGDSKTFTFDVSNLKVNSVSQIKIALMEYWYYCAADGRYYDMDNKTTEDGKTYAKNDLGKTVDVTSKSLAIRTMQMVEFFASPITTVPANGQTTTTTTTKTTASTSGDGAYQYAGYHFYDFTSQGLNETYGNNPSYVNFMFANYYQQFALDNHTYADGKTSGTKKTGNSTYISDYTAALNLPSKGYQVELNSPYPRAQQQHQVSFFPSGKVEDASRVKDSADHKALPKQNEKYDYFTQMGNAIKYANNNPDPTYKGYLAVDVNVVSSLHGYKNTHNATYKAWCKKNGKTCADEKSAVEVLVAIHATDKNGQDASVNVMQYVNVGEETTLYVDVSELDAANIYGIRLVAQNYANLANKQEGGNDGVCGITDVQTRYSAIYVPGKGNNRKTTKVVTEPVDTKEALVIYKLYKALPGDSLSDYNTVEDYNALTDFLTAYDNSSVATKDYLSEKYGITMDVYIDLMDLLPEVESKIYPAGYGSDTYDTGDLALPILSVVILSLAGYVVIRTRKKKA